MEAATLVAGVCLVAGLALMAGGVYTGLSTRFASTVATRQELTTTRERLAQVSSEVDRTAAELERVRAVLSGRGGLESSGDAGQVIEDAATAAAESTSRARSALEQVGSIVGSLPEDLRFPGLLVLVGTVLTSVATIQFGGTSLF